MKSESWDTIRQAYEDLPSNLQPKNAHRIEGYQHMFDLIPRLEQNRVLGSGGRLLSHYSLKLLVPNKDTKVVIIPPGLVFSGSTKEFCIALYDDVSNKKLLEQRISYLLLDEIVKTAEKWFLELQQDKSIP